MRYRYIIFDLDGTLLDTSPGVLQSVDYTIQEMGFSDISTELKHSFIGPPIKQSLTKAYGLDEKTACEAVAIFRDRYKTHDLFKAQIYPGIVSLLEHLNTSERMLAVATLKREDYAIDILKHFGLAGFYNIICGSDHESKMSKADVLLKCIGLLKAERSDCVLIGDTVHDAIGAQQAEIDFLAVTFGFGFKDPSDVAAYPTVGVCDSAAALQKFLDME